MIEYRKADKQDIEALVNLRVAFLGEVNGAEFERMKDRLFEENRRYFQQAIAEDTFVAWMALNGGEIVATTGLTLYEAPPTFSCVNGKIGYISNVYTLPRYRAQGIASKLMERLMAEAKDRGCTKVVLNATDMGRPVYEKIGFMDAENEMVYLMEG